MFGSQVCQRQAWEVQVFWHAIDADVPGWFPRTILRRRLANTAWRLANSIGRRLAIKSRVERRLETKATVIIIEAERWTHLQTSRDLSIVIVHCQATNPKRSGRLVEGLTDNRSTDLRTHIMGRDPIMVSCRTKREQKWRPRLFIRLAFSMCGHGQVQYDDTRGFQA